MESWNYKPKVINTQVHYVPTYCPYGHERIVKNINCDYSTCDPVKYWCSRSKKEIDIDCDAIKISILWPVLFVKDEGNCLRRNLDDSGLSLDKLQQIGIMEQLIELVKSVCDIPCFIRGILIIADNSDFKKSSAINWVESTGNVKAIQTLQMLGPLGFSPLEKIFKEFQLHIECMASELMNVKECTEYTNCPLCIKKGDLYKAKGNEEFSKEHFELAIKSYTKGLEFYPENHLLYGNRALCYLRLAKFPLALADGKRATILKQKWFKGHHRFCDALYGIGKHEQALEANIKAQKLCEKDPHGLKELIQQNLKFRTDSDLLKDAAPTYSVIHLMGQNDSPLDPGSPASLLSRSRKEEMNKRPNMFAETFKNMDDKGCSTISDIKITKLSSESSTVNRKANTVSESKSKSSDGKSKTASKFNKQREPEKLKDEQQKNNNSNFSIPSSPVNCLTEMLKVHVDIGHRALLDQCFYNAKQAFSKLLDLLDPLQLKKQNISTIDYILLIYGHASALLGIGKPEELMMAEQQLNKIIENYTKQRFNCLAYYGIGNVYLRQNRFVEAINQFNKSKVLLNENVVPGVLRWPTTSVVIEESCPDKLLVLLEKSIEECKFPPKPDAICHFLRCQGYIKKQIYFTDPDFEGFVRILCSLKCQIEFHINCWTKQKEILSSDMYDVPDFLKNICFMPDCMGFISSVDIYSSSGLVQSPYEENISKDKGLQKTPFKEKITELDKLASKQEQISRKMSLGKDQLCFTQEIKEVTRNEENFSREVKENTQMKISIADPVLRYVMENAELIMMGVLDTGLLMSNLLTWDVIDEEDHRKYSASIPSSFQYEVMGTMINLVASKSSRVKIRVFLHVLNILPKVDTKLHDWLTEINNIGLKAAASFLSCYADCLQKLDLGLIHMLWNENFGIKLNSLITGNGVEVVVEYFRHASPEKARCLIWLLDENEEKFQDPPLHQALDNYFTVMDCPYNTLGKKEKQDLSKNGTKVKSKKRKKKQKNPEEDVLQLEKQPHEQQKQPKDAFVKSVFSIFAEEKYSQTEAIKEDVLQLEKQSHEQQKQPKDAFVKSVFSMFAEEKYSQTEAIKFSEHHVNTDPLHPFEQKQGDIIRMDKNRHVLQGKLKEASEKYELSRTKKMDEINDVELELKTITEENKVSKTELDWFYKDLENEVKKWQQEKKEYQEKIRAVKSNIKKLMDSNETCMRSIEEKKQQYQKKLNGFLESSNKFENEKMKLEENIKKGKDQIIETSKRAVASEVSILENQKNVETFKLRLAVSSAITKLSFLCSVENSVSPSALPEFKSQIMSWNTYLTSISKEMENVVSQFEERIDLVKSGAKLKSLQPVLVEMPPSPPTIPVQLFGWNHTVQCKGQSAPNGFIGLVDCEKEGEKDTVTVNGPNNNSVPSKHPTLSTYPWKSVRATAKSSWKHSNDSASFEEDPCVICHEELCQKNMYILECGHRFHKTCIHTWLNTQSTCPTCRIHVLLNEDFPALTSRKRPT